LAGLTNDGVEVQIHVQSLDFRKTIAGLAACFCLLSGGNLRAVQVSGTNGTSSIYTTARSDDFGFANVGQFLDTGAGFYCSGVYLGNGWMISAYHVPYSNAPGSGGFDFGPVILDGTTYAVNPATAVRIVDPSSQVPADLAMFQLTTTPNDPNLKTIVVSTSTPNTGSHLYLMGNGANRATALTYWNVTGTNTSTWTWTTASGSGNFSGYDYGTGQSLRWGNGFLDGTYAPYNDGYGTTSLFSTVFTSDHPGSAMVAGGDSGGGVFYKNGTVWNLCGILLLEGALNNQPNNTSVFGDPTYSANLAYYSTQINSVMTVPLITSGSTVTGTSGSAFIYQITAVNTPSSYDANGLPSGITVNSSSGVISGTATLTGTTSVTFNATISAINSSGTGSGPLTITMLPPPPDITTVSGSQTDTTGQSATFSVSVSGASPFAYQWYADGVAISGATSPTYTIPSVSSSNAGSYTVTVTDQYGDTTSITYTLTVDTAVPAMSPRMLITLGVLIYLAAIPFLRTKRLFFS
jgi:hypothetical protein